MLRSTLAGIAAILTILPPAVPAQAQVRGGAPLIRPGGVGGSIRPGGIGGGIRPGGLGGGIRGGGIGRPGGNLLRPGGVGRFNGGGFAAGAVRPDIGAAPFRPGIAGLDRGGAGGVGRGTGAFRHYGDRRGRGAAIGAGIAGLAAGAVIGGALANQGYYDNGDDGYVDGVYDADPALADSDDTTAYCERRFRSYDPDSGTYLGSDGIRHPCP